MSLEDGDFEWELRDARDAGGAKEWVGAERAGEGGAKGGIARELFLTLVGRCRLTLRNPR